MPPPDLLMRISTPSPDYNYPIHSPTPSLPLADRLSIFDKRWSALFGANIRSETSSQPPAPSPHSDKLVYPPTETHCASISSGPKPPVAPDTELLACLRDYIASFDSTAAQQPKIFDNIILLEQDLQNIADQSSLDLDTAHRAEALAQNSLITAKEAVALAQENVSVALAAKDRADQALIRVAQLRNHYKSDTNIATGEQARTNLMHNLEGVYQVVSRQAKDKLPVTPTGLSRDALSTMAAELTRKIELSHASRKRKRRQDLDDLATDSDLPYPPSKELRIEQNVLPSVGPSVESLVEAAREAWNQEAERRSVIPPEAIAAEGYATDAQQIEDVHMQSAQGPATQAGEHPPALSPEQVSLPSEPSISKQDASFVSGPQETEDPLQGQRRRELEEQKREITKFQMRERESQESPAQRIHLEDRRVVTPGDLKKNKDGANTLILPTALGTSTSAPNEGHIVKQQKTGVSDKLEKVERRLAMEKQQAPVAQRSGAQTASVTQPRVPQSPIKDGQSASEPYQQGQDSLHQMPEHGKERKMQYEASMNTPMIARVERVTNMVPNVGNIVAQQTLTGPSIKARDKNSCSPRGKNLLATATRLSSAQVSRFTLPTQGTNLPPRLSFQPTSTLLQPLNRENVPRNPQQDSIPPINEPSGDPVPSMNNVATPSPMVQALQPKAEICISVSQDIQPANLKSSPNITTTSSHKALPPVSIKDVKPKAEILSPTITSPPIPPLSQMPSNSVLTVPQQNATNLQDSISHLRYESRGIAAAANSGSNVPSLTAQAASNEIRRQSDSPPALFFADQPTIPSSHSTYDTIRSLPNKSYRSDARPSRGWSYGSSLRHFSAKRSRHRGALDDDDDGRHWSPPRNRYFPRTPSRSPPVAFCESIPTYRPLSKRIEGAYDLALQSGNETYRPYHPVDPADRLQEWRDTGSYYTPQVASRPPLADRLWGDIREAQPLRRFGRGGLRLEERIT